MTETGKSADADPIDRLEERIGDLGRILARQTQSLDRLVDADRKREAAARAGADLPLLVELLELYADASACTSTAATEADRVAFAALRDGLDRLIVGRGGSVIAPHPGTAFDVATMDAVDVIPLTDDDDPDAVDRTVVRVVHPGLRVGDRAVRAALVVVYS
ncbi:nucleotide exchange factor GrpE [Gordonia sp. NB41Y]|uniref:nucleotide exchange factor GrpE n=1 Tax=Gordonia sp. NB41Y TaxID=875808 RepID=UPI0002BF0BBC|nr:nucleotide exchange factor GrpE [Gordonia sp. NB41Y]KOY49647.1 hypothetical protein ISGA_08695 [Gordonia sp. NB41Y]WLP92284.1 nucleotide exchange factor GrpE [Gordonia sp. NB41Y]